MLISKNKSRAPFRLTRVDTPCRGVSALLAILLYNSLLKNTTPFVNLIELIQPQGKKIYGQKPVCLNMTFQSCNAEKAKPLFIKVTTLYYKLKNNANCISGMFRTAKYFRLGASRKISGRQKIFALQCPKKKKASKPAG